MNLAVAIGGLAFLILIHEAGHFLVALAVRMRPRRFYVFFPPALVKRTWRGIEYGLGSIPLGGYVKIPGMHKPAAGDLEAHLGRAREEAPWLDESAAPVQRALAEDRLADAHAGLPRLREALGRADLSEPARRTAERGLVEVEDGLSGDAYWRAPAWKRIAVIVAGPGVNLVFAVGVLAVVFMLGIPEGATRVVEDVSPDRPAAAAGLQPGDRVVAVGETRTGTFQAISDEIQATEGRPVTITVERDGREVELGPVRPELEEGAPGAEDDRYIVGFRPEPAFYRTYGFFESFELAGRATWEVTKAIGASLGRIITGSGRDEVASVVGITQASSQSLEAGFRYYLQVLALISLSLALLNLLPLLPLDGGHIAFSVVERIRGRAIPREAYERVSAIGIAVVLFLFVIGLTNDIDRIRDG
ncbi:MAG TPA: site-2 protease family protein [Gaiellaceae bacterium]|nr:site-2 protease family protein [Gaiellaceae bacterium]